MFREPREQVEVGHITTVEIPAKQVVKARIAKQLRDVIDT